MSISKEKRKIYNQKYREEHPDYNKTYWKNNKHKLRKHDAKPNRRFTHAKSSAKRRNKEWSISFEEYEQAISQPCFYCKGLLGKVIYSTGLDRLDNSKGYIPGNVASCCTTCNKVKGNHFTTEETLVAIQAVIRHKNLIKEI